MPIHEWLFKHIQDALLFADINGKVIDSNDPADQMLGQKKDETLQGLINFNRLKKKKESHELMEVQDGTRRLFEIKSLRMEEKIYSLILRPVSLIDKREK